MKLVQSFLTKNPCYVNNVNKADSRYTTFQTRGPLGAMLHSVGCAQPSAQVFINSWNNANYTYSCVHGIIDANDGTAYQLLPWNYRGWHGGGSSNNTHIGVEMCESKYIKYLLPGESGYAPGKFVVLDQAKARADCTRAYNTAVELFAMLATMYKWNVDSTILSHYEGGQQGIASGHGDPEHYWKGLGMSYTMNGFRAAVKAKMQTQTAPQPQPESLTEAQIKKLIAQEVTAQAQKIEKQINEKLASATEKLSKGYGDALTKALASVTKTAEDVVARRIGKEIIHLSDIPGKKTRNEFLPLLERGFIDGGTPAEVDDLDIRLPWTVVRSLIVAKRYFDARMAEFLMDSADCGDACEIHFPDDNTPGDGEE